jgi:hypothetical protein
MTFGYGMNPYGTGFNPSFAGAGIGLAPYGGFGAGQMPYPGMQGPGGIAPFMAQFAPNFASPYAPPMISPYTMPYTSPFNLATQPPLGLPFISVGGLGGLRPSGASYSEQFLSTGLPTDTDLEEMIYDAIDVDPLIPADCQIDVTCESGTCTLTGDVPDKMVKHAAGQDAWWTAGVVDVVNNLNVTGKGPARAQAPKARLGARHGAQAGQQRPGQQPAQTAQYHAQEAQRYAQQGGSQG